MKVIWSPLSVERLDDIFKHIEKDNSKAAHKMVEGIISKVGTLSEYPYLGRIVPETNIKDIRELFEGEYRIIYRVSLNNIFILTIRNFKQLLPEKDLE
jgi:plasmid stabilization system protein ParE